MLEIVLDTVFILHYSYILIWVGTFEFLLIMLIRVFKALLHPQQECRCACQGFLPDIEFNFVVPASATGTF